MISRFLRAAISLILGAASMVPAAQNTIVLQNTPVDAATIERITFDATATPPLLIARGGGSQTTMPLLNNAAIPFFSGLDIAGTIYEAPLTDQTWTLYYLTPIGYFYLAPINALLDPEEQQSGDTRQVWLYQSFDSLEWAFITTDESFNLLEGIEYTAGELSISYATPAAVETTHIITDGKMWEASLPYDAAQITPDAYTVSLQKMICCLTQTLADYAPEPDEAQLAGLLEKFKSLLGLPVVQTAATNTFATAAAQKFAKKKVTDRNYTIYPVTGRVSEIYDSYVGCVEGRLNCASYNFKKNAEYGIVYATTPGNCVVGKGTCVKARQEDLKLTFATELENLQPGTTYYYRTYAKISKADKDKYSFKYEYAGSDTGYGKIKQFKTAKYCFTKLTWWMLDNPFWDFDTSGSKVLKYICISRFSAHDFEMWYPGNAVELYDGPLYEIDKVYHHCSTQVDYGCHIATLNKSGYDNPIYARIIPGISIDGKKMGFSIEAEYGCNVNHVFNIVHIFTVIDESPRGDPYYSTTTDNIIVQATCSEGMRSNYSWSTNTSKIDFEIGKISEFLVEKIYAGNSYDFNNNSCHIRENTGKCLWWNRHDECKEKIHDQNFPKSEGDKFNFRMKFLINLVPVF